MNKWRLMYVLSNGKVISTGMTHTKEEWESDWAGWLSHMVEPSPDVNFFFVGDTTDIWEGDEPGVGNSETPQAQ